MTVQFDSHGKYGDIDKSVFLFVAGANDPITISLKGETFVETQVRPTSLDFGSIRVGNSRTSTVSFGRIDGLPLKILKVSAPSGFRAVVTQKDPQHATIAATFVAGHLARKVAGDISILTDDRTLPRVDIPVLGTSEGEYSVAPWSTDFGEVPAGTTSTRTVRISGPNLDRMQITSVPSYIHADLAGNPKSGTRLLVLTLIAGRIPGKVLISDISLATHNGQQPTIVFKTLAAVPRS
jgi:hypothetical protein